MVHVAFCCGGLPDLLVDDHTHSSLGNVEHSPCLPVVELMRHAFVVGTIALVSKRTR